jgi:ribose transport system ATP-binding protein
MREGARSSMMNAIQERTGPGGTVVEIDRLSKAYPGVQALDSIDLFIRGGEIHALLGQNGAGKSTLIKVLSGVNRPDSGRIFVDGRAVSFRAPHEAQRNGIFTIYQELSLVPDLSVAENIFIADLPRGAFGTVDWRKLRKEASETMEWLGFSLDVDDQVRDLSVAQKQGVELAKALHHEAKVVLLDEPSAALPRPDVERLFDILRALKSRGLALVYISHRLEEVEALCDTATVLCDGRKIGTYRVSETKPAELVRAMIGRELTSSLVGETSVGEKKPRLGNGGGGEVVLSARDVSDGRSIRGISFDLHRGEILGVTGLIGNGQAELAACLFGARACVAGEVRLRGKRVRIRKPAEAIRAGIGLLPEERKTQGLVLSMSIESNVTMASLKAFSRLSVINHRKEKSLVGSMMSNLKVRATDQRQMVGSLSGGNQQKIVLAKWLATNCEVLIFSEPTRGIDIGAKEEIYNLIREYARNGGAVVLISSEMPEAMFCDRVFVMSGGAFVGELEYDEIDAHADAILNLCCR